MRTWIGSLIDKGILITHGIKKGTDYLLNPDLFAQAKLNIKPTLKTIESYKLEALIVEDLKYNGKSKITDIQSRLVEIPESEIRKTVYGMVKKGDLTTDGGKKNRSYNLFKKK